MRVEVLACKAYAADADARSIRRWAICAGLIWLALCREAVEWAEFGPMELDERLLTRPEVHTMVRNSSAEAAMCRAVTIMKSLQGMVAPASP